MRVILAIGTTNTATIDGITAAGATPTLAHHTPSADAELLTYGTLIRAPTLPVSPTGCPTPALITRAVRTAHHFPLTTLDAGLTTPTAAPTVDLDAPPGNDIRDPEAVPTAHAIHATARNLAQRFPDDHLILAESIPAGTTTALGVLRALGEPFSVSSSLPDNPIARKHRVVDAGLTASDLAPGDAANDPMTAIRTMGDPVLAALTGIAHGAIDTDTSVTLAGGTQMLAVAAALRHTSIDAPLHLATTPFVAEDPTADLHTAAAALDIDVTITDPGFTDTTHPAMAPYTKGEAKEGVGMGGALYLATEAEIPMHTIRHTITTLYDHLVPTHGP